MKRSELEHLIRAAAAVTNEYELVVIGSQSILGTLPSAPEILLQSMEADVFPLNHPELADVIDGAIGEASPFQHQFGYYAQGVGPETAILPDGWKSRLIKIQNQNTDLKIGYCLEPHDLAVSKLVAWREKDRDFVSAMIQYRIINTATLKDRIADLPASGRADHQGNDDRKRRLLAWVEREEHQLAAAEIESARRIQGLSNLADTAGASYTFWQQASAAIQASGSTDKVNWQAVEKATIQESLGVHLQSPESVVNAILEASPGAVLPAFRKAIYDNVKDWNKRNVANPGGSTPVVLCER